MDLNDTELQAMLRQTASEFAEREFPMTRYRELVKNGISFDPEIWSKMSQLQWPGLAIAESYGGAGAGLTDLVVLLEEMGKALLLYPFLSHTLAGLLIQEFGSEEQKLALLPDLARGDKTYATAVIEQSTTWEPSAITASAEANGDDFVLSGVKHFVRGGNNADALLVLARVGDSFGFFVVDPSTNGVTREQLVNIGDDDQALIRLDKVPLAADSLIGLSARPELFNRALDLGALLECAYAIGLMDRDTKMTIEYVGSRVQFGRPIGSFQAVHHQVADQVTDVESSRYLTYYAAFSIEENLDGASESVAHAKAFVSDSLRRVTRTGQQLHGGIGYSIEYDLHYYYQRAKTSELMFGQADDHRERIAAALLDS